MICPSPCVVILDILANLPGDEVLGRDLRGLLRSRGFRRSAPALVFTMMSIAKRSTTPWSRWAATAGSTGYGVQVRWRALEAPAERPVQSFLLAAGRDRPYRIVNLPPEPSALADGRSYRGRQSAHDLADRRPRLTLDQPGHPAYHASRHLQAGADAACHHQ